MLRSSYTRLCESVPLRDAVEGGCTEVDKVLCLKKGVVVGTCLFKSAQQIHPNKTSRKVIACQYGTGSKEWPGNQ